MQFLCDSVRFHPVCTAFLQECPTKAMCSPVSGHMRTNLVSHDFSLTYFLVTKERILLNKKYKSLYIICIGRRIVCKIKVLKQRRKLHILSAQSNVRCLLRV